MNERNIQADDVVHIRGRVISCDDKGLFLVQGLRQQELFWCKTEDIVHIEPRPLKIGDSVVPPPGWAPCSYTILAIHDNRAWVHGSTHGKYVTFRLADLRRYTP